MTVASLGNADSVLPASAFYYGDTFSESLMMKLLPIYSRLSRKELLPTYSVVRLYQPGHILIPHKDRVSCQYSVTMCLGMNIPEEHAWYIKMDEDSIQTGTNQAVFYKGCELEHSREVLQAPEDTWIFQAHFHYIDRNDPEVNQFYLDKRPHLGHPYIKWNRPVVFDNNNDDN